MPSPVALILYWTQQNKNSLTALVGALETCECFDRLAIYRCTDEQKVLAALAAAAGRNQQAVVCMSFFTSRVPAISGFVKKIRAVAGGDCLLVAGGPHPTGDPHGTLEMGFDIVVCGEGEKTFTELMQRLCAGYGYHDLNGIACTDAKGTCLLNGPQEHVDLDQYPPFSVKAGLFGPIEVTRGCPFRCGFCQTPSIFPGKVRHRSIEAVCRYVEALHATGRDDIRFVSPNTFSYGSLDGRTVNLAALEELFRSTRKIIGRGGRLFVGSFPSEVRPEQVTPETLDLLQRYAANDNIVIGAQSGSQRMLDACRRGHTVDDIMRAVTMTMQAGFKAYVDFIFGLPGETEEDVRCTMDMITMLAGMGAQIHAHTFMPLPQTPFAAQPPGRVSRAARSLLHRLTVAGSVFGQWQQQERIAAAVYTGRQGLPLQFTLQRN